MRSLDALVVQGAANSRGFGLLPRLLSRSIALLPKFEQGGLLCTIDLQGVDLGSTSRLWVTRHEGEEGLHEGLISPRCASPHLDLHRGASHPRHSSGQHQVILQGRPVHVLDPVDARRNDVERLVARVHAAAVLKRHGTREGIEVLQEATGPHMPPGVPVLVPHETVVRVAEGVGDGLGRVLRLLRRQGPLGPLGRGGGVGGRSLSSLPLQRLLTLPPELVHNGGLVHSRVRLTYRGAEQPSPTMRARQSAPQGHSRRHNVKRRSMLGSTSPERQRHGSRCCHPRGQPARPARGEPEARGVTQHTA
mmetsp:Transcript_88589/g.228448  ORF Transcript_88589/g.228448 Transcript_88589/m.228448 type:complete len:306 (+) Transcript_88589:726-1643(+)